MSQRLAVFAYGSLASLASAERTLGRPVQSAGPARLAGWWRSWSQARDNVRSEKTFALADGATPSHCLGLNVERRPGRSSGRFEDVDRAVTGYEAWRCPGCHA